MHAEAQAPGTAAADGGPHLGARPGAQAETGELASGYAADVCKADVVAADVFRADCPARPMLDRVADKWTALVMGALEPGTKRFQQLRREVGGVSQKMLTQTLRALERDGLVARRVYATVPTRVEYTLTPLGRDLTGPLGALRRWVETHRDAILAAQARYDAAPGPDDV